MIARASTFGIISLLGSILLASTGACGPSRSRPPPPRPDPGDPGDSGDSASATPRRDAGATAMPDLDPLPSVPPPAKARAWLKAKKVSWPTDRWPAQFHPLGGDTTASIAYAVSGDGSTPVGVAVPRGGAEEAVRWRNGTMEPLATPGAADATTTEARAASFDGRVVAGSTREKGGAWSPLVWREGDPPRRLLLPEGEGGARVFGLSRDGTMTIGCAGAVCELPLRWLGDHPAPIEGPRPFNLGTHPVTIDGKVVVGMTGDQAGRLEGKSVIRKDADSFASSITDDGKVMVGRVGKNAVMWRGKRATVLGKLPGHDSCRAVAVSADAGRVVGNCTRSVGPTGTGSTAWVWDAKHGMRPVADALATAKVTTIGWSLDEVHDICSFGVTLVGHGSGPNATTEAWMAIVPRWP